MGTTNESNHDFWARCNKQLDETRKIDIDDADQIFERTDIEIETMERENYVMAKIRMKKQYQLDVAYDSKEKDFLKKWANDEFNT